MVKQKAKREKKEIKIKFNGKTIKVGKDALESSPGSSEKELVKQMKKAVSKRVFEKDFYKLI